MQRIHFDLEGVCNSLQQKVDKLQPNYKLQPSDRIYNLQSFTLTFIFGTKIRKVSLSPKKQLHLQITSASELCYCCYWATRLYTTLWYYKMALLNFTFTFHGQIDLPESLLSLSLTRLTTWKVYFLRQDWPLLKFTFYDKIEHLESLLSTFYDKIDCFESFTFAFTKKHFDHKLQKKSKRW